MLRNVARVVLGYRQMRLLLLGVTVLSAGYAVANTDEAENAYFEQCKQRLIQQASAAGVRMKTAKAVMSEAEHLPRIIELDRNQPEFTTTFADYLNRRVNEARVKQGRRLLQEHKALLAHVAEETGVPAAYLLAFWGLETNFGGYKGKVPVPSALTTLACDDRRSKFFTQQLIAALQILDEGAISLSDMVGSWAGAMGHVQFMPTVFLKHAVDGDGDGKRDLWHSVPDAMMSAGKFLQAMGWNSDYRWGREVLLPAKFNYALAGGKAQSLQAWSKLGVVDAFSKPLTQTDMKAKLIVPSGHQGPAFLAYDNFNVIMGWNRSEYYAIAVGYLADRIAGAGVLQNPPPKDAPALSRNTIMQLQQALNEQGFHAGEPDGILGPASRKAIRNYQHANKMIADGYPSQTLLNTFKLSQ